MEKITRFLYLLFLFKVGKSAIKSLASKFKTPILLLKQFSIVKARGFKKKEQKKEIVRWRETRGKDGQNVPIFNILQQPTPSLSFTL